MKQCCALRDVGIYVHRAGGTDRVASSARRPSPSSSLCFTRPPNGVPGHQPSRSPSATGSSRMTTAAKPKADDQSSDSGLSSSSNKSEQTKKTPKSNPTWHTEVSPPGAVPTEPSVASVPARTSLRKRRASVDELMLKAKSGAAEAYRGLTMDPAKALQKKRERLQEAPP
eukprot:s1169_g4.t1